MILFGVHCVRRACVCKCNYLFGVFALFLERDFDSRGGYIFIKHSGASLKTVHASCTSAYVFRHPISVITRNIHCDGEKQYKNPQHASKRAVLFKDNLLIRQNGFPGSFVDDL